MGVGALVMMRQAVFLDRDGVLNEAIIRNDKPYPPASLAELKIPLDAGEALFSLKKVGFLLIGATNQPDVARGKASLATVELINQTIQQQLCLDDVYVCFHDDVDQCACRKPLPGLLVQAAKKHNVNLQNSFMIGDRWKDIDAGFHAGCKTILLRQSYQEKNLKQQPNFVASSLCEAAEWILSSLKGETT